MSHDETAPSSYDGLARLFPLAHVVLFPRVMLPLHIFEPRYRQLTADALATDELITLVLLKTAAADEQKEPPPLHSVACLGKIVADQRLQDGRYQILLRGLSRVRILNEVSNAKLYRSAWVELLQETGAPTSEQTRSYCADLAPLVARWLAAQELVSDQLTKLLQGDLPLGTLVDILAFALPLFVEFKQELLQELHVVRRAQCLLQYLRTHDPPKGTASLSRRFPPEFSAN